MTIDTKHLRLLAEAAQIDQAKGLYGNDGYCQFKTEMQPAIVLELLDGLQKAEEQIEKYGKGSEALCSFFGVEE